MNKQEINLLLCKEAQIRPGCEGTSIHWHNGCGVVLADLDPLLLVPVDRTIGIILTKPLSTLYMGAIKLLP